MWFLSDLIAADFSKKRQPLKDKRGGLTPAGRRYFREKTGSRLRPGVKKKVRDMSPSDMRRKGSWARRHFGAKKLPPMVDKNGNLTRASLQANAWGERPPRTKAQARAIAAKGSRLLERYHRVKNRKK